MRLRWDPSAVNRLTEAESRTDARRRTRTEAESRTDARPAQALR